MTPLRKETKNELIDRSYKLLSTYKLINNKWEEIKNGYLIFPKQHYKKPFKDQKWTERITEQEYKKRLKQCHKPY